jgi:hypothetical protein
MGADLNVQVLVSFQVGEHEDREKNRRGGERQGESRITAEVPVMAEQRHFTLLTWEQALKMKLSLNSI